MSGKTGGPNGGNQAGDLGSDGRGETASATPGAASNRPAAPAGLSQADLEALVKGARPPPRWPVRLALVLGVVALGAAIFAWVELSSTRGEREHVRHQIDEAVAAAQNQGAAQAPAVQTLKVVDKGLRQAEANWARRRLGFFVAALVLIVGGFFAGGLRSLYDKLSWIQIDPPEPR